MSIACKYGGFSSSPCPQPTVPDEGQFILAITEMIKTVRPLAECLNDLVGNLETLVKTYVERLQARK